MLKKTPLNEVHREMGAHMAPFGGWDMPIHYGSQIEEHHQVRRNAGMFDVSHMLALDFEGAGTREFLKTLLANNVDKLRAPGRALYSCMLNPAGFVLDDLIVYYRGGNQFRVVVNAGNRDQDIAWIQAQQTASGAQFTLSPRRDLAMIAAQGPLAREKVWQAILGTQAATASLPPFHAAEFEQYFIARTGYTGEDGFEILLPESDARALWNALHDHGVSPIGLGARDTLRLEAGMNLCGQDMDATTSPLEAGLAWTVDLTEGRDFIGKPALLRMSVEKQFLGLVLQDKGVLRSHQKVHTPHGEGEITSGGFSPTLNLSIAFARLPKRVAIGDGVFVEIRGKLLRATVVKPPFVRHGKNLIEEKK